MSTSLERVNALYQSNRYCDPYEVHGSFVLDGATDPSVFGGHIASVTREANATPTIVFRVNLLEQLQGLGLGSTARADNGDPSLCIFAQARGPNGDTNDTQVYNVNVLETGIDPAVATPAFVTGRTIDIVVVESAMGGTEVGTAVDTAGIVVSFSIKGQRVRQRTY